MERLIVPAKELELYPEGQGESLENFKQEQGGLSSSYV